MMHPEDARIADTTATRAPRAVLLGRDVVQAGAVATAEVGPAVAVGLARGWRPKPYAYVDPNEDVAGAAVGLRARLLVVGDGHNGHQASHAAVGAVMDLLGDDPRPADLGDEEMAAVARLVEERIAAAVPPGYEPPGPRTTLVVALRTETRLQWFGAGDSALVVSGPATTRVLPAATRWFLAGARDRHVARLPLAHGAVDLAPAAWVVAVTDGWTDYLPDGLSAGAAVARAVGGGDGPGRAVGALLDQARRGGAGDNVGVSVSGPW